MRTIFFLFCILSVTVTTQAQSKRFDKFVPGSFVDTTNKVYTGYVSWTMADQNISAKARAVASATKTARMAILYMHQPI